MFCLSSTIKPACWPEENKKNFTVDIFSKLCYSYITISIFCFDKATLCLANRFSRQDNFQSPKDKGLFLEYIDIIPPLKIVSPLIIHPEAADSHGFPLDIAGLPTDIDTFPSDIDGLPTDIDSFPTDIDRLPTDIVSFPTDIDRLPTDINSFPTDIDRLPTDIDSFPPDIDRLPTDIGSFPSDIDRLPMDMPSPRVESNKSYKKTKNGGKTWLVGQENQWKLF
jgi:hypothetical protein